MGFRLLGFGVKPSAPLPGMHRRAGLQFRGYKGKAEGS